MEEHFRINQSTGGDIEVTINASQSPGSIKKLLDTCADEAVGSIAFIFSNSNVVDFCLLQVMALLHKKGKKISINGDIPHTEVVTQVIKTIIS